MAGLTMIVAAAPDINSDGMVEWGVRNIIPIVLLVIGIGIIAGARKGQMSQNALTLTNVLLGCGVIAGATVIYAFADSITTFVFQR
ncbi:MAG: hypothetical protein ACRDO1_00175 [Nocardioidaceae bacterium]|nr:hypothetical protein [Propionibacteriales bacterium]